MGIFSIAIALGLVGLAYMGYPWIALALGVLFLIPKVKFSGKPSFAITIAAIAGVVVFGGLLPEEYKTGNYDVPNMPLSIDGEPKMGIPENPVSYGKNDMGELNFRPTNGAAGTYAGSGVVAFTDPTYSDRYQIMKQIQDKGTSSIIRNGVSSPFRAVSSGNFQDVQFSGKVGDRFGVYGYLDVTPAAAENISFYRTAVLTDFNPQSGTNGGVWSWKFEDSGSNQYQWNAYAGLDWYDSGDAVKNGYRDQESAAVTKTLDVYVHPGNSGEQTNDVGLYLETAANSGNVKEIKITGPTGKTVTYTALQNTANMNTGNPEYLAAPATNNSGTMYYVGAFPDQPALRTASSPSQVAKYTVSVQYDHPATAADWLVRLAMVENHRALTTNNGHYDATDDFVMNLTANTDFSDGFQ